jgi:hypothetical protein
LQIGVNVGSTVRHSTHSNDQVRLECALHQVTAGTRGHSLTQHAYVFVHGHNQHTAAWGISLQSAGYLNARCTRHADICEDHIWLQLPGQFDGLLTIGSFAHDGKIWLGV